MGSVTGLGPGINSESKECAAEGPDRQPPVPSIFLCRETCGIVIGGSRPVKDGPGGDPGKQAARPRRHSCQAGEPKAEGRPGLGHLQDARAGGREQRRVIMVRRRAEPVYPARMRAWVPARGRPARRFRNAGRAARDETGTRVRGGGCPRTWTPGRNRRPAPVPGSPPRGVGPHAGRFSPAPPDRRPRPVRGRPRAVAPNSRLRYSVSGPLEAGSGDRPLTRRSG